MPVQPVAMVTAELPDHTCHVCHAYRTLCLVGWPVTVHCIPISGCCLVKSKFDTVDLVCFVAMNSGIFDRFDLTRACGEGGAGRGP